MPELWLPYGEVEIALDIKAENLAEIVNPQIRKIEDPVLKEQAKQLPLRPGSSIVLVDSHSPSLKFLDAIISIMPELGIDPKSISVSCQSHRLSSVKKLCENVGLKATQIGEPDQKIAQVDNVKITAPKQLVDSQALIVTETRLDPLFGFTGGLASIIRLMNEEAMAEAFGRRIDDNPHPGKSTPSSEFCESLADSFGHPVGVEIVPTGGEVAEVLTGEVLDAHHQAVKRASDLVTHNLDDAAKIVILSPGRGMDSTLSSSLAAAWNALGALREKGWLIIAAECSRGLGSEAAQLYVTGRMRSERTKYVWGLEDLVFLQRVIQTNPILMVSTLPHYYLATKLGVQTARRLGEAFDMALESLGSRTKGYVVTSSSDILLASKRS